MAISQLLVLAVVLVAASGEVVKFKGCSGVPRGRCTVSEVRVTPCPSGKRCEFERNKNAALSFDFTPNFSTSNLQTQVYYNDIPFADLGKTACEVTTCPSVAGTQQTLNYELYIGNKIPGGRFPISWKVWNGDNPEDVCCFTITIQIPSPKKE